jgi:hypothetical protein
MKRILTVVFITLFVMNLFGQWQENGIPIRNGVNISWTSTSITLPDNSVVVVWTDTRTGFRNVYANKIDSEGNMLWEEGIYITDDDYIQAKPTVVSCPDNSVIISWVDKRQEYAGDVYAQKVTEVGVLLWDESGIPICTVDDSFTQYDYTVTIEMISDTNNGAYIVWTDGRNHDRSDLYGTHILEDGTIATGWEVNGNAIAIESGAQYQHTLCADGQGGAVIAWYDSRNYSDVNIYIQRFVFDGTMLWGDNGTLLCDASSTQSYPKIIKDVLGDFIIAWKDKRNGNQGDVYAQKIDINGNTFWGTGISGIEICTNDGEQRNVEIASASDASAFIVWEDNRTDSGEKDIYAQKINFSGELMWDEEGIAVTYEEDDQYNQINPKLVGDNSGGTWIVWEDGRFEGNENSNIYLQHLNSNGEELLEPSGKMICNEPKVQSYPAINLTENNAFLVWADGFFWEETHALTMQIVDDNGNEFLPMNGIDIFDGICGFAGQFHTLENGSSPIMLWEDYRDDGSQIFMQTMNNDGSFNFEQNGIPITSQTGSSQLHSQIAKEPNAYEFGVVWQENRLGNVYQTFAQIMQTDGTMIGLPEGILLSTTENSDQNYPNISTVDNNGNIEYYTGWSYGMSLGSNLGVYAQKIVEGEIQWNEEGVLVLDSENDDTLKDIVENFYIIQNGLWNDQNIIVQKLDETGNIAEGWAADGLVICDEPGNQKNPQCLMIPEGLMIVWSDLRTGDEGIYAQLMDRAGNFLWQANGVPLVQPDIFVYDFSITYDNDLYLAWAVYLNDENSDVFAQKFNLSAEPQWEETGVLIAEQMGRQRNPNIIHRNYPNHETVVFWSNLTDGNSDLYSQTINETGELGNSIEGEVICDVRHYQQEPQAVLSGNDVIVFWEDQRASDYMPIKNIYAQKLSFVDAGEEDINPISAKLSQNYPNPFNPTTTIKFTTENPEDAEIEIYNIKGQKVDQLQITNNELRIGEVIWNAEKFSSGIYFYKLKAGKEEVVKKMVLIK